MAVLIPEAVEATTAGEAAVGGAGARAGAARAARGPAVVPGSSGGRKQDRGGQALEHGKRAARRAGRARLPGNRQYQPVILAEFLVAVLVVAIPPLATGGDQTAQDKQSPSPYSTDSLKQLVAVGAVYFILALMSGSKRLGRASAWFGGLVLIGLGLLKTANGDLQALFKVFAPGLAAQQSGQETPQQMEAGAGLNPAAIINPFQQQTTVAPPPGGTGTIESSIGPGLALPDARGAVGYRGGRHDRQQPGKLDCRIHAADHRRIRQYPRIRGLQDRAAESGGIDRDIQRVY